MTSISTIKLEAGPFMDNMGALWRFETREKNLE